MVIPNAAEAVFPFASFTTKMKVLVPDPVGVPDSTPVLANVGELRPVLQEPLQPVTAQVYGAVPPLAVSAVLYGVPTVPLGRGLGVMIAKDDVRTLANAVVLPPRTDVPINMAQSRPANFRIIITEFS